MSKDEINPGENCPHCRTTSKPGSTVCTGCGAVRRLDYVGTEGQWVAFVEKSIETVIAPTLLIAILVVCMSAELRFLAIAYIIAAGGLGYWTITSLRKKYQKYAWFIQTPK